MNSFREFFLNERLMIVHLLLGVTLKGEFSDKYLSIRWMHDFNRELEMIFDFFVCITSLLDIELICQIKSINLWSAFEI